MIRILLKLIRTIKYGDKKMSASTDALAAAIQNNTIATNANTTAVNAAVLALGNSGTNDAAITAAASTITANTATINANNTALAAATPVVPTV